MGVMQRGPDRRLFAGRSGTAHAAPPVSSRQGTAGERSGNHGTRCLSQGTSHPVDAQGCAVDPTPEVGQLREPKGTSRTGLARSQLQRRHTLSA